MIVQVHFNEGEIKAFFEKNGFEMVEATFGNWSKEYHNRCEWNDYLAPAVKIDGKVVEASKLFEKYTQRRLKEMIAPCGKIKGVKNSVETCFNKLLKSI